MRVFIFFRLRKTGKAKSQQVKMQRCLFLKEHLCFFIRTRDTQFVPSQAEGIRTIFDGGWEWQITF